MLKHNGLATFLLWLSVPCFISFIVAQGVTGFPGPAGRVGPAGPAVSVSLSVS